MELDDLKTAWAAQAAAHERSLAINEWLLRETLLRKARVALAPYVFWRVGEVAIGAAMFVAVVSVLVARAGDPLYAFVAGALAMWLGGLTVVSAYLLTGSLTLDYGKPALALQRDLERLQLVEFRALTWAVLGGVAAWLPLAAVLLEAATGVDALARIDRTWLVSNVVVGVVVLALGHALARIYVDRQDAGRRGRWIVEALSGHGIRRARAHLAELARFEREDSSEGRA